jgi:hypothetical protein
MVALTNLADEKYSSDSCWCTKRLFRLGQSDIVRKNGLKISYF